MTLVLWNRGSNRIACPIKAKHAERHRIVLYRNYTSEVKLKKNIYIYILMFLVKLSHHSIGTNTTPELTDAIRH